MQHISAIYENGVLRPLDPLDLRDHEVASLMLQRGVETCPPSVTEEPTLFDVLDEAGLIGCIQDAPPDLSANPIHMQCFGKSGG